MFMIKASGDTDHYGTFHVTQIASVNNISSSFSAWKVSTLKINFSKLKALTTEKARKAESEIRETSIWKARKGLLDKAGARGKKPYALQGHK